jgi:hypothetical protein
MSSVQGTETAGPVKPWDAVLLEDQDPASLVAIARDRRLVLEGRFGPQFVDLCWVDEVALSLIERAVAGGTSLDLVYPAPAGQVAVLLAAQLLLYRFVRRVPSSALGVVTADTTMAARTWDALRIATVGAREPLTEVFPCFRAGPDGSSPTGGRHIQGLIVGQRCDRWPVDFLVVDHLAGPVVVDSDQPAIEVFSDPLDPALRRAEEDGRLIWGWSEGDLARWNQELEVRHEHTISFSVASDRIEAMAHGTDVTITVARHPEAEGAIARVHEDLRLLRMLFPHRTNRHFERGMSAAWHHLATLISLPCTPSQFDRFAGVPPWAARATMTFASELSAWAGTLTGEQAEYSSILASDIADLRAALDRGNPFEEALTGAMRSGVKTLVVTRTRTASRAMLAALGGDPDDDEIGNLTLCPMGRLHRVGTWFHVLMIGEPSPWDWHRLLSGLSENLEILTLGSQSATGCARKVDEVRSARDHWGSNEVRGRTWHELLRCDPPPAPRRSDPPSSSILTVDGAEFVPEPDPFESFTSLFELDPLDLGGEGPRDGIARRTDDGDWAAEVTAVAVLTDHGQVLLESGRQVEVRVGPKIVDRTPELLEAGDVLLIGRHAGRVGLIEALEEHLADRPDLLAARLLIDQYHELVRTRFIESGITIAELHRRMAAKGCDKTSFAVRSWVTEGGIMAPRDRTDLESLNDVLELSMSDQRLSELFAGVQRRRNFRRAAGRALAEAARSSTVAGDQRRIDDETGLSIADLRDAVIEATVISTEPCDNPMPLTLIGRMEQP